MEEDKSGFTWLLKEDKGATSQQSKTTQFLLNVEDLILETEFVNGTNYERQQFLTRKLMLSEEKIKIIAEETTEQSRSNDWVTARKHRLTASNFGKILGAVNRNSFPKSFWQSLLGKFKYYYILFLI